MKLSARWEDPLPPLGSYLKSARGRFAYRVCGVHVHSEGTIDRGEVVAITTRATFTVERISALDLPANAFVQPWSWTRRTPKTARNR